MTGVVPSSSETVGGHCRPGHKRNSQSELETVLPLPEARKAQELSKGGHSGGKIVLVLEVNGR